MTLIETPRVVESAIPARRSVATDAYWLMPGPRAFLDALASAVVDHRWVAVHTPSYPIHGLSSSIAGAIRRAHLDNEQSSWIRPSDRHDIAAIIGTLFRVSSMPSIQLAQIKDACRTVILEPETPGAIAACRRYLEGFKGAAAHVPRERGQVSLVVILPPGVDSRKGAPTRAPQDLVFSGALSKQEMQAYVAVRMTERPGPADTELFRMLVTEFAGFDPQLAEELIALTDEQLLGLPDSLSSLGARHEVRWRTGKWVDGCFAHIDGAKRWHVLHELYLSETSGPQKSDATEWLRRRYWRACVRSLLPWLEEHRPRVIGILREPLERHLKSSGGRAVRTTESGHRIETSLEDLEYNRICAMVRHDGLRVGVGSASLAVEACFSAKKVRDHMAHLRPPSAREIQDMINSMQRALPHS
jgi:hypothetical protein